jgi:hypothetical protein
MKPTATSAVSATGNGAFKQSLGLLALLPFILF